VIIPGADHGQNPFYVEFFPGLGSSIGAMAKNAVLHPSRLWRPALRVNRLRYYLQLFGPVAFLPVFGLGVLALGVPQLATNAVSSFPYTYRIHNHYHSLIIAAVFLAVVEVVGRRRSPAVQGALAAILLLSAVAGNATWSPSPLSALAWTSHSDRWHDGTWQANAAPRTRLVSDAVASIPSGGGVSTSYYIVPHVTHRQFAYEFPNPWIQANWGSPHNDAPPNPATVDYLVVDRGLLVADHDEAVLAARAVLAGLLDPTTGQFETVFDQKDIVFAHRRGTPLRTPAGIGASTSRNVGDQARSAELAVVTAVGALGVALWWSRRRRATARRECRAGVP
jgi:hypothetical protein